MAAENWSFTPALDNRITTAETNGKLVITVKPNVFTTDTQYTVKYDDKNGCTASTIFYIKENCSGGGGGDEKGNKIDYTMVFVNHSTTTIEKNSVDDSGVFLFLKQQHLAVVTKEGSLKEKWPSAGLAPNAQTEITVTCKTNTGDPNEYIDKIKSWEYQYDNIDLDTNKAVRFYYPGHNSDTIMALPLRNKKSDGSLAYRTVGDDTNKMYIHLYDKSNQPTDQQKAEWYASQGGSSSVCIIQGKTLNATDSGEKVIGVLPTNGTWSFNPGGISWLGSITQHGTDVKASNVITNDGNSRYVVFTGTCADCSDCTGTHTFKVTQNGNGGGGGSCDSLPKTNPFHITLNISVPAAIDGWTYDEGQSIDLTNNTLKIEVVKLYLIDKCECEGTDDEGHDYTRPYSKYGVAFGQTTHAGGSLHEIPIGMITPVDFYLYDKDGDSSQYVGMENANIGTKFLKNGEIPSGSEHMIYVKGTYKDAKTGQIISSDHIGQYVTCVFEDENYTLQDGGTYNVTLQKY
jgi:hypothetical protein